MPHIHTGPGEYENSASAYIVRLDHDEPKLILHKHKKLGKYMQFGGHIETKENLWEAVTHELREESGYDVSQLTILQPKQRLRSAPGAQLHPVPIYQLSAPFTEDHFHTDTAYAFVAREDPLQPANEGESGNFIEVTCDELRSLSPEKTLESVRTPGLFVLEVCVKEWEEVDPHEFA